MGRRLLSLAKDTRSRARCDGQGRNVVGERCEHVNSVADPAIGAYEARTFQSKNDKGS